ncbi:MAG: copper amine oxidase N-terminal domain-containing protein [Peptoniphilus sp.]|nr:copper amine oxidase N-terminal domain-containing protein [Peptoniphilus sp.]MDD7362846.1 copper amine oxidase N-terminal domain-containing protein [Bacillota bacterium]MDY6043962.1 copper amine oxidase N-terminal domain-containing protein [Peptoniphilus sp.]
MKKRSNRIALLLLPLLLLTLGFQAPREVTIYCNGVPVKSDQSPIIEHSRTFVPVRVIAEYLGAEVSYDAKDRTVYIQRGDMAIDMTVGEAEVWISTKDAGGTVTLDVPVFVRNNRTMLPVRAVSELFGMDVAWNGEARTVSMSDRTENPEEYVNKYNAGQEVVQRLKRMGRLEDEFYYADAGEITLPAEYGGAHGYFVTVRKDHPFIDIMTILMGHYFIDERGAILMESDPVTGGYIPIVAD